jgi:hypothetical protein
VEEGAELRRLRMLKDEIARLKRLIAGLSLDRRMTLSGCESKPSKARLGPTAEVRRCSIAGVRSRRQVISTSRAHIPRFLQPLARVGPPAEPRNAPCESCY